MNTRYIRDLLHDSLIIETGELDDASVGLHIGSADIENPVLADMIPATFTGYAAAVVPFGDWDSHVTAGGEPYVAAAPLTFSPTNGTNLPQTVNAYYIFQGANLISFRPLAQPLSIVAVDQSLHVTPTFGLGVDDLPDAEGHIS